MYAQKQSLQQYTENYPVINRHKENDVVQLKRTLPSLVAYDYLWPRDHEQMLTQPAVAWLDDWWENEDDNYDTEQEYRWDLANAIDADPNRTAVDFQLLNNVTRLQSTKISANRLLTNAANGRLMYVHTGGNIYYGPDNGNNDNPKAHPMLRGGDPDVDMAGTLIRQVQAGKTYIVATRDSGHFQFTSMLPATRDLLQEVLAKADNIGGHAVKYSYRNR